MAKFRTLELVVGVGLSVLASLLFVATLSPPSSDSETILSEKLPLKKFWKSFWTPLTTAHGKFHVSERDSADRVLDEKNPLRRFFGLQPFPGTSLQNSFRITQLHQEDARRPNDLRHFFGIQSFDGSSLKSLSEARTTVLREVPNTDDLSRVQYKTDNRGYLDSQDYQQQLTQTALSEQKNYMNNWHKKRHSLMRHGMAAASSLFNKWTVVDPYTGMSRDDLAPYSSWQHARQQKKTHDNRARTSMMFEVKADDNGKTYSLPWWCILYHQEATGAGKGLDGGKVPIGASGFPGTDCSPPSVSGPVEQLQGRAAQLRAQAEEPRF